MNPSTARHEARHAAAGLLLDVPVWEASAIPDERANGYVLASIDATGDPEHARRAALLVLAGRIGDEDWPPPWPLPEPESGDERQLARLAEQLALDASDWKRLTADAFRLSGEREFGLLEGAIALLLEDGHVLDHETLHNVHRLVKGATEMEHLVKAASVINAELGQFSAIAATYSVDRANDAIIPGAFARTIARWQESGKNIPLHWNHSGDADAIIGSVDPASMRETSEGLFVEGQVDLDDSAVGREAWRSMKRNRIGLSFGYVVNKEQKRNDGVTELLELDVFEISAVPSPANAETRFLGTKGVGTAGSSRDAMLRAFWGETIGITPDGRRAVPDVVKKADWRRLEDLSGSDRDQRRRFAALTGDAKAARPAAQDVPIRIASFEIR